jgi:hypothetical protein
MLPAIIFLTCFFKVIFLRYTVYIDIYFERKIMPTRAEKAGSTLAGGLGGAGLGATIGSVIPGLGTAIGAGIGGLGGLLSSYLAAGETDKAMAKRLSQQKAINPQVMNQQGQPSYLNSLLFGNPAATETYNRYTPEQQAALSQLLQQSLGGLGGDKIEEAARKGFKEQTIPTIAERFTQLGAQRSSAFPQLLSQAASDLETNLAAMKEDRAMRLLQAGLSPQIDTLYRPGSQGALDNLARELLSGGNVVGAINALKDMYNKKQNPAVGTSLPALNIPQQPALPSKYQSQTWTSNPANLVKGTSIPGGVVPGIGTPPNININNPPKTGYGAMKALYGI